MLLFHNAMGNKHKKDCKHIFGIATRLRDGRFGVGIPKTAKISLSPKCPDRFYSPPHLPFKAKAGGDRR